MSARVLVVDDQEANRRLLQARLASEYYEVSTASRGEEGVQKARRETPDIILLDVMMPGGVDGFEACRRLKLYPETRHIPIVMVTTLNDRDSRLLGLQAGAEDFLTKPIDEVQLLARLKSLMGLKVVIDELLAREASGKRIGVIEDRMWGDAAISHRTPRGSVLVVDDNPTQFKRIKFALGSEHRVYALQESAEAGQPPPDLAIVSVAAKSFDGYRVMARMHSHQRTRHLPILAIIDPDDREKALRALDLGAHDIIARPLDDEELIARARTLMRRKRYMDALRETLDNSLELAVTDQLTGLFNRRFLIAQTEPLLRRANCGGDPLALMIADIDHFKAVNDTYGHDVGDEVLREFAARLATNARPADIACRLGGEEFVTVMPATNGDAACQVAERIRRAVAAAPFHVPSVPEGLSITASMGVAAFAPGDETIDTLLKRADQALYDAKRAGRNRVIGRAA